MKAHEVSKMALGLTTDRALRKLYHQLQSIRLHNEIHAKLRWTDYHQFIPIPYPLMYISTVILFAILATTLSCQTTSYPPVFWNFFAVVLLISSTVCTIVASIKRLEWHSNVIVTSISTLLEDIKYMRTRDFPRKYAPLYLPHSLSYNLQMTYRDGKLANVPVSLLVEGDIINLRPGQTINCDCVSMTETSDEYSTRYSVGETFLPHIARTLTNRSPYPSVHLMDKSHLAVVTTSPAIEQIKNILRQKALNQKVQLQNTSSFTFLRGSVLCSTIAAAIFFIIGIITSSVRVCMHNRPVLTPVPILWIVSMSTFLLITTISLFVPLIWILTLGMSVMHLSKCARSCTFVDKISNSPPSGGFSILTNFAKTIFIQPDSRMEQLLLHLGRISRMCFVDKKGIISLPIPTPEKLFFFRERQNRHRNTMRTRSFSPNSIPQSSDILTSLPSSGSIKMFRNSLETRNTCSVCPLDNIREQIQSRRSSFQNSSCVSEILNINSSPDCLYKPRFESPKWDRHLESLKPIGLNILLNNCQPLTREHYAVFADHLTRITASSRQRFKKEDCQNEGEAVAVVNNRCLCGLSYQMGFLSSALRHYSLAGSLGIYKANEKGNYYCIRPKSGVFRGEKERNLDYFRSQALRIQEAYASVPKDGSSEPIPVPNCFCTIYREAMSCGYHVMTQGSGDLITALCTNFWNGYELLPLLDSERTKMLDFYNLNVSTSYCLAFAYMPLLQSTPLVHNKQPASDCLNHAAFPILKLPVNFELRSRLTTHLSPTSTPRADHLPFASLDSSQQPKKRRVTRQTASSGSVGVSSGMAPQKISDIGKLMRPGSGLPRVAFSCGSLPRLSYQTDRKINFFAPTGSSSATVSELSVDPVALQDAFSKQTFLGMVSLQYQAMPGIVETIRKLNQACIRFVHFSQENQLRSRVFAERLGLEADWNCHISLADPPSEVNSTVAQDIRRRQLASDVSLVRQTDATFSHDGVAGYKHPYSLSSPNMTCVDVLPKNHLMVLKPSTEAVSNSSVPLMRSDGGDTATGDLWIGFDIDIGEAEDQAHWTAPCASAEPSNTSLNTLPEKNYNVTASIDSISPRPSSPSSSTDGISVDAEIQEGTGNLSHLEEDAYNYVFANKSRLPSGIRNIRTHLENIDNVPLKVSLFTDSTPSAVDEMIRIMQEYGETVCVVGSCLSMANVELFYRGDTAIALFPLLPRVCGHEPIAPPNMATNSRAQEGKSCDTTDCANLPLLSLAGRLVALGAALISRASPTDLNILQLISQAHASVNNIHLCVIFAVASSFAVSIFYLLLLAFLPAFPVYFNPITSTQSPDKLVWLPPVFIGASGPIESANGAVVGHIAIGGRVVWLIVVVIPCLATSIFGRNVDRNNPLQRPPIKRNEVFSRERLLRMLLVNTARFLPSVIICWTVSVVQAFIICPTNVDYRLVCLPHIDRIQIHPNASSTEIPEYADVLLVVSLSQEIPFFLLVVYLVFISFSYANAGQCLHRWRFNTNLPWLIFAVIVLAAHSSYLTAVLLYNGKVLRTDQRQHLLITLACGLFWCPFLLFANEAVNWKERLLIDAEARFAKLFFDTKLGMYSPV